MLSSFPARKALTSTMTNSSVQKSSPKKDWVLTPKAFRGLLAWLDDQEESDGQNYLEMRRRLVVFFDRKNCLAPDDLADETLNRVARRLEEEGKIESDAPAKYCYIVARYVFMEHLREAQGGSIALDNLPQHRIDSTDEESQ